MNNLEREEIGKRRAKARHEWTEALSGEDAASTFNWNEVFLSLTDPSDFNLPERHARDILKDLKEKFSGIPEAQEQDDPAETEIPTGEPGAFDTRETDFLPDPKHPGYLIGNRCGMLAVAGKGRRIGQMLAMFRQWKPRSNRRPA